MAAEYSFKQDVINLWKDSYDGQEPILDLLGAPTEKLNLFLHLMSGIFIPILIVNTLRIAIEFLPRVGVLLLDHAKITTRDEDSSAKKAAKYVVNSTLKLIKAPLSLLGMLSEWLLDWRHTSIFSFAVAEQPPAEASPSLCEIAPPPYEAPPAYDEPYTPPTLQAVAAAPDADIATLRQPPSDVAPPPYEAPPAYDEPYTPPTPQAMTAAPRQRTSSSIAERQAPANRSRSGSTISRNIGQTLLPPPQQFVVNSGPAPAYSPER